MTSDIPVLIADDHPVVRQGLRMVVDAAPGIRVVGEAGTGTAALDAIRRLKPRIAILDVDMPELDGFGVARAIRDERLDVAVIFLTVHREEAFFDEAMLLGARAYVLKDSAVTDIVSGIRAVAGGQHYTSPALTSYLVARRRSARPASPAGVSALTPTERQVLALLAEYKTSREIGDLLHISHRTVQTHRANICAKLELHGSHALMKFALAHKAEL
jgi:DNA-binding NarL/FixJ family response regulator